MIVYVALQFHLNLIDRSFSMTDTRNQPAVRYAIYLRSATGDRASLREQEEVCRAAAASQEPAWTIDEDLVFTDTGSSGNRSNDRPGLAALLKLARETPRRYDVVLVASCDRLDRDLGRFLRVVDLLSYHGVRIHFADTAMDSQDTNFRNLLIFGMQYEDRLRQAHSDKVRRGQHAAFLQGRSLGGRQYGYRSQLIVSPSETSSRGTPAKLSVVEGEAEVVRHIFSQFADGMGITEIARRLNERGVPGPNGRAWRTNSIRRLLRNSRYRGTVVWNRTRRLLNPFTGRSEVRRRSAKEFFVVSSPELKVVDDELAARVDARLRASDLR